MLDRVHRIYLVVTNKDDQNHHALLIIQFYDKITKNNNLVCYLSKLFPLRKT